ncbi:hypothetical protein HDU76_005842 [Blyttiomyces sp. JEL0837]|nr:hypothetical protein HDU76_005842 [Blyttiomyces sp. JEL0837]
MSPLVPRQPDSPPLSAPNSPEFPPSVTDNIAVCADNINPTEETQNMIKLRVGCVPEHFSCPLYIAAYTGMFKQRGIDVELVNCPGGTGEMIRLLQSRTIDIATALTEGLIAPLARGEGDSLGYRIIGTYTSKPLTWSVAVNPTRHAEGAFNVTSSTIPPLREQGDVSSLKGMKIGISRFGSGSHIIPFVVAAEKGWLNINADKDKDGNTPFEFVQLKDINGLKNGVVTGEVDAFLWERFTTKRYYDAGELHHLTNVTPPWPAFLFAATTECLSKYPKQLATFLDTVSKSTSTFMHPQNRLDSVHNVMKYFDGYRDQGDVIKWFETVGYPQDARVVDRNKVSAGGGGGVPLEMFFGEGVGSGVVRVV